jgi:streptomycin 6-kinase
VSASDLERAAERLTQRFGPGVASWCAGIPGLARSFALRWALSLDRPFPVGNSSVAFRCTRSDGSGAVLKLSPDLAVVAEQVATLRLFGASGRVPAVLAADVAAGAALLALIEPGTQADQLEPPPSAREWAGLLTALHGVSLPPGYPHDLRAQCEGFFARIGGRVAEPAVARWVSAADVALGAERCEALLATETVRVLLHGDLHLANVLDGGAPGGTLDGGAPGGGAGRRLVAIDPRACVGDPCFDAVDYLLAGAGRDGVGSRCTDLAAASGLDSGRLHAWCRAIAPIVAITYLRRPDSEAAVAELLALAR